MGSSEEWALPGTSKSLTELRQKGARLKVHGCAGAGKGRTSRPRGRSGRHRSFSASPRRFLCVPVPLCPVLIHFSAILPHLLPTVLPVSFPFSRAWPKGLPRPRDVTCFQERGFGWPGPSLSQARGHTAVRLAAPEPGVDRGPVMCGDTRGLWETEEDGRASGRHLLLPRPGEAPVTGVAPIPLVSCY